MLSCILLLIHDQDLLCVDCHASSLDVAGVGVALATTRPGVQISQPTMRVSRGHSLSAELVLG